MAMPGTDCRASVDLQGSSFAAATAENGGAIAGHPVIQVVQGRNSLSSADEHVTLIQPLLVDDYRGLYYPICSGSNNPKQKSLQTN